MVGRRGRAEREKRKLLLNFPLSLLLTPESPGQYSNDYAKAAMITKGPKILVAGEKESLKILVITMVSIRML